MYVNTNVLNITIVVPYGLPCYTCMHFSEQNYTYKDIYLYIVVKNIRVYLYKTMKDTFDFTSYVRSGKLHEAFRITLEPRLKAALSDFSHDYIVIGSPEWDQMVDTIVSVTGMQGADLTDFLIGDFTYKGASFSDYMEGLDIRIMYEDDFEEEDPHQTSDTFVGPKGIEEVIKEVLSKKLS